MSARAFIACACALALGGCALLAGYDYGKYQLADGGAVGGSGGATSSATTTSSAGGTSTTSTTSTTDEPLPASPAEPSEGRQREVVGPRSSPT